MRNRNAESVGYVRSSLRELLQSSRVARLKLESQGCRNPGLELANAFSVLPVLLMLWQPLEFSYSLFSRGGTDGLIGPLHERFRLGESKHLPNCNFVQQSITSVLNRWLDR